MLQLGEPSILGILRGGQLRQLKPVGLRNRALRWILLGRTNKYSWKTYLAALESQLTTPVPNLGIESLVLTIVQCLILPSERPPHVRSLVENTVQSFDDAWLLPPQNGELFYSDKACLNRLQGFALSRGFVVATTSLQALQSEV